MHCEANCHRAEIDENNAHARHSETESPYAAASFFDKFGVAAAAITAFGGAGVEPNLDKC